MSENNGQIKSKFIFECLNSNELGDGTLYVEVNRGDFVYNASAEEWLQWDGHHWTRDLLQKSLAACEKVVDVYLNEYSSLCNRITDLAGNPDNEGLVKDLKKKQSNILKRVSRLRSVRGRTNCLKFANSIADPMAILGDEIDSCPWLLACENGVIDLETGEIQDGRPNDYLLKSSPVAWEGIDAPRKLWEKTLLDIFAGDQEVVDFVQRLFGASIVGKRTEDIMTVFSGRGRNGKSLIVDKVSQVLGDLAGPIPAEMLLDQGKYKSASGPSPDIMALRGLRIAFASETDEHRKFSSARVKWLTGGDELTGRNPHDKYPTTFKPTHTLILLTNHRPHAPSDDFAFWRRMVLIPFTISFSNDLEPSDTVKPEDKTLPDKLDAELPGILAWLVEGCLKWQQQGLALPFAIKEANRMYQREEDLLADFLDECCSIEEEGREGATKLHSIFSAWWAKNISNKPPKQKTFGTMMAKKFEKIKINGIYHYSGLSLIIEDPGIFEE